jgi:hypothetical protein
VSDENPAVVAAELLKKQVEMGEKAQAEWEAEKPTREAREAELARQRQALLENDSLMLSATCLIGDRLEAVVRALEVIASRLQK